MKANVYSVKIKEESKCKHAVWSLNAAMEIKHLHTMHGDGSPIRRFTLLFKSTKRPTVIFLTRTLSSQLARMLLLLLPAMAELARFYFDSRLTILLVTQ